jgi:hypothetical protein
LSLGILLASLHSKVGKHSKVEKTVWPAGAIRG